MANSRRRHRQLKKRFEEEQILLKGSDDLLWTYDDDAEDLAAELGMEVQYNSSGKALLKINSCVLDEDEYALIGINGSDDEFFLRYVVCEEEEVEPDLYPATTWYVAEIESQDEIRRIIVVDDPDKTAAAEGVYNRKHPFAEAITAADAVGESCFTYEKEDYRVEFLRREDPYLAFLEKRRYFLDPDAPKTIHIYSSKNYASENHLRQVSAYVFFDGHERPIEITAYYSPEREEYFLSLGSLNAYRMKYGFPYIMADQAPGEKPFGKLDMAEESIFRMYGYSVDKKVGLLKQQRQEILARMIDFGIVTKWQAMNFLEGMPSLNERNPQMKDAIRKWREDLLFIHEYQSQGLPEIWGELWLDFKQGDDSGNEY